MSIPTDAKKVFEGIYFDVYHWQQKMFDGSYITYEAIQRRASVQIIAVMQDGTLLLLKEAQPHVGSFISVVGGGVERNETPLENAHKELLEEVGIVADSFTLWREENMGQKVHWPNYYFIAKGCKVVQEPNLEAGEKITPYYVSFDQFIEEVDKPEFRNRHLSDMIFRIKHTPGELDKFKGLLFD